MRRPLLTALIPCCLAGGVPGVARAAPPPDAFQVRTTADLVAVCQPSDEASATGSAQLGFCQGFVVGAYRVIDEIAQARPSARFFCMPTPPPTRTTAIAAFLTWVQLHPGELSRLPTESIGSFLAATYPCPAGGAP